MKKTIPHLRKEITLALIVKLILIYALWALFFQHPVAEKLDGQSVAEHIM